MKISQEMEKKLASQWFTYLQRKILEEFQNLELEFSKKNRLKVRYFRKNIWRKDNPQDGGGAILHFKKWPNF